MTKKRGVFAKAWAMAKLKSDMPNKFIEIVKMFEKQIQDTVTDYGIDSRRNWFSSVQVEREDANDISVMFYYDQRSDLMVAFIDDVVFGAYKTDITDAMLMITEVLEEVRK